MLRWSAAGLLAAVAIAWLAALVHRSCHAPVGLVSLGAGTALGASLYLVAASLGLAGRGLVVGTVVLALLTVLAQHAWLYHDFRRQWHEARTASAEVALFRPEAPWSPREYFRRELTPRRAALWAADAALVAVAAVAVVLVLRRQQASIRPGGRR